MRNELPTNPKSAILLEENVTKVATRDAYGDALVNLGKKRNDVVVLDADLSGSTKTSKFAKVL